jgi:hypothetical protein
MSLFRHRYDITPFDQMSTQGASRKSQVASCWLEAVGFSTHTTKIVQDDYVNKQKGRIGYPPSFQHRDH